MGSIPQVNYLRMKEEVCRAYNDYLLDNVTNVYENIRAQAMMPLWNPEATVEELERIGHEEDITGASSWFGKFWRLGNPEYNQVFEKLVELDLPLTMHLDVASYPDPSTPMGGSIRTWIEAIGFCSVHAHDHEYGKHDRNRRL